MHKVILDTNILLVPGQFKVDIFSEIDRLMDEPYELIVLEGSLDELEKIIQDAAKGEDKRAARLGKMLLEHHKKRDFSAAETGQCKALKILPGSSGEYVDDAILSIAEDDTLVATNDNQLKRRLLERGVRVISLKQQQYLTVSA